MIHISGRKVTIKNLVVLKLDQTPCISVDTEQVTEGEAEVEFENVHFLGGSLPLLLSEMVRAKSFWQKIKLAFRYIIHKPKL